MLKRKPSNASEKEKHQKPKVKQFLISLNKPRLLTRKHTRTYKHTTHTPYTHPTHIHKPYKHTYIPPHTTHSLTHTFKHTHILN